MSNVKQANINIKESLNYILYQHLKINGNVFYVGISNNLKRPYIKSNRSLWWKNIVKKNDYEVQILKKDLTKKDAIELEQILISYYGRQDLGTGILVNMTNGGEGCNGVEFTEERKRKISEKLKGRKLSENHRLSLLSTVTNPSKETRLKMSLAKKNKKLSKEHCDNIKKSRINFVNYKTKKVIDTQTNIIYNSIKEASNHLNINYDLLRGRILNNRKTSLIYYGEL